ncbi:transposase [Bradyrhizobium retamae]|uniref:Transposase n=1 Tax=Bradyrhizobium retamae TaxID=1300035 RepID=A0A0R3NH75_9BRAD|nr:hypothetical protein CQ13_37820 [Bradyrhizobium retamae]
MTAHTPRLPPEKPALDLICRLKGILKSPQHMGGESRESTFGGPFARSHARGGKYSASSTVGRYASEGGRLAEVGYCVITGSMDTISTANNAKVMEVVDTGRRRFSIEAKQRIVEESYCCGDPVTVVARRHGLFPGQLFGWRRLARQGALGALNPKMANTGLLRL